MVFVYDQTNFEWTLQMTKWILKTIPTENLMQLGVLAEANK